MSIQVDVQGRNDLIVMGVLMLGQLVGEVPDVVVVDEGDRADGLRVRFALVLHQGTPG